MPTKWFWLFVFEVERQRACSPERLSACSAETFQRTGFESSAESIVAWLTRPNRSGAQDLCG